MSVNIKTKVVYINSGIIEGILPKCNIINKNFSRIYFEIFVNGQRDAKQISKDTEIGYRSILSIISFGKQIGLFNKDGSIADLAVNESVIKDIDNTIIMTNEKKAQKINFKFINENTTFNSYQIPVNVVRNILQKTKDIYLPLFSLRELKGYTEKECYQLLGVTKAVYKKHYNENEIKELSNKMDMSNFFTKCPVCNEEFDDINYLITHIRKSRKNDHKFLKKYIEKVTSYSELMTIYGEHKNEQIQSKPKKEKTIDPNKEMATKAFNYYYLKINENIPPEKQIKIQNRYKEINMIKSHLSLDLNYAEVIEVIDYLIKKRKPLLYFNSSINDARTLNICKKTYKNYGTAANLIRRFQEGIGENINDTIMIQGYRKVESLLKQYDYKTLEATVEYMIKKDIKVFNFIDGYVEKAKKEFNPESEAIKYTAKELAIIMYNEIDCNYGEIILKTNNEDGTKTIKKKLMTQMKQDIINGNINRDAINSDLVPIFDILSKKILMKKEYSKQLSENEWINKINYQK